MTRRQIFWLDRVPPCLARDQVEAILLGLLAEEPAAPAAPLTEA